jgi:cytidine deaminase
LSDGDGNRSLQEAAEALLAERYVPGRHEVAAALRSRSGAVYLGLHVDGSARRTGICAEGMAIGAAAAAGDLDIDTIVAVQYKPAGVFRVISPCGVCRELIHDYSPDAIVINYDDGRVVPTPIRELLPAKTARAW